MEEVKPQGTYLKAILISFLYGLIGVVAYVVIGGFGQFVSAWISFAIALGIKYGYDKAKGPKKGRIAIIVLMYLIQTFIAIYMMFFVILSSVISVRLVDVIPILLLPEMQTAEVMSDYVVIAIFTVLGLGIFFLNDFSINRQKKFNSGEATAKGGKRFSQIVPFSGNFDQMSVKINEVLAKNKYTLQSYGEEQVYRNGDGIWVASKFIKFAKAEEGIVVEAFIIAMNKEDGIDGFVGVAAKKPLKKVVDEIIALIQAS